MFHSLNLSSLVPVRTNDRCVGAFQLSSTMFQIKLTEHQLASRLSKPLSQFVVLKEQNKISGHGAPITLRHQVTSVRMTDDLWNSSRLKCDNRLGHCLRLGANHSECLFFSRTPPDRRDTNNGGPVQPLANFVGGQKTQEPVEAKRLPGELFEFRAQRAVTDEDQFREWQLILNFSGSANGKFSAFRFFKAADEENHGGAFCRFRLKPLRIDSRVLHDDPLFGKPLFEKFLADEPGHSEKESPART